MQSIASLRSILVDVTRSGEVRKALLPSALVTSELPWARTSAS